VGKTFEILTRYIMVGLEVESNNCPSTTTMTVMIVDAKHHEQEISCSASHLAMKSRVE
jgi:hypothetical protein